MAVASLQQPDENQPKDYSMSTEQQSLWQEQLKLLAQERDAIAAHCDTLEKTLKHTQEVIVGMKLVLET